MSAWLSSAIALSLCLAGCNKKENAYRPKTQELRLNLHSEPPTIDPRKATDSVSNAVIKLCFEGLTRIDPNGRPIPAAAEKIEISSDGKRYTFTLRDAKWSDGKPVTASDFERTWKEILNPAFPCEFAIDLYMIKNAKAAKTQRCPVEEVGIKALNEKTLEVDLEHPVPYFLSALSTHAFFAVPSHITERYPNWTYGHYVGNGAFSIQEWRHQDRIVLGKNPHYWDIANTTLERIVFAIVEDETTELTMFENNELDWAGYPLSNLPTEALTSLSKKGSLESFDIAGTYYYIFNTKQSPFNNTNIRRAFALAINRQAIVANVTQMDQVPATGLIPPSMWKDHQSYFKDNDLVEAKRLFAKGLEELGVKSDEFPAVTLSYNTYVGHHKIAQAIQEQWHRAFGIRVKLENKEWKVFLDELRHHKFQIARMGGIANVNDPSTFLDFYRYLSSNNNHSQWNNPEYSEILEQADQIADPEQRMALLKQAEKILISEMPIAPIYFYKGAFIKKPYVKGVYLSELNDFDLKWAYVEVNDQISR